MKQKMILGSIFFVCSILLSYVDASILFAHMLKCILLAYAVTMISNALLQPCIKAVNRVVYTVGIVVLLVYTIIAVDTYIVHTLEQLPGILRYALFSTYGWWYVAFTFIGFCLCFKENNKKFN